MSFLFGIIKKNFNHDQIFTFPARERSAFIWGRLSFLHSFYTGEGTKYDCHIATAPWQNWILKWLTWGGGQTRKILEKTKAQNSRQSQVPMPWFPFQLATFPLLKQTCTSVSLCKFFCVINITVSHGVCTFSWNGHHIEIQYLLVFSWSSSLLFLRVH